MSKLSSPADSGSTGTRFETVKSFNPDWEPPEGDNRLGLAFLCDSPADVDATYERLTSKGYRGTKEPWDAFWGQRYALVADPDGVEASLFAPLDAA
jgi:uncharacterized glyoxalase superfamily protein PhnB